MQLTQTVFDGPPRPDDGKWAVKAKFEITKEHLRILDGFGMTAVIFDFKTKRFASLAMGSFDCAAIMP